MVTASIVLFKNDIRECRSILGCLFNSPIDKVFLVDHSGDTSLSVLASEFSKTEYISQENLGYGAGHNLAIKMAVSVNSKYHLIVNADILFDKETIVKIIDYLDNNPDVAHVMPKVFYPNGDLQYLCKLLPSPFDMFSRGFLPSWLITKRQRLFTLAFSDYSIPINAPYLSGCFMFIRTNVLQEIGGFDERFFLYPEDIDLTRRIHEKYKTIMYPEVSVIHNHAAAHRYSWKAKKIMIVNMIRYFNKWGWFFDKQRKIYNKQVLDDLASNNIFPQ